MNQEHRWLKELEGCIISQKNISKVKLRKWMQSDDIELHGAIILLFDQYDNLLQTMPKMETIIAFYNNYFYKCIINNPNGKYAENRYTAAQSLVKWYRKLRESSLVPENVLEDIRLRLREIYKRGNNEIRNCIINGVLEHLFNDAGIIEEFADWLQDKDLKFAYEKSLLGIES